MLVVVALVALCYFGGNYCPSVLKQNKKMLLGVAVGLVLCSFFGMKLEGLHRDGHNTESARNHAWLESSAQAAAPGRGSGYIAATTNHVQPPLGGG